MAITGERNSLPSGRAVDAWCRQGFAGKRSSRASGTSGETIHFQLTPFKMESRQVAKSPATRGLHDDLKDAQLDLKDACYTVPVHHKHRRYLHSSPFGLSSYTVRTILSLTSVHQDVETCGGSPSFSGSSSGALSGRHSNPTKPGLHSETGEVLGPTMCNYDDCQGSSEIPRNFFPNVINPLGTDEPCISDWTFASSTVLPKSATRPYRSNALIHQPITVAKDSTVPNKLGRTSLVGISHHAELQWPTITNTPDRDDCLNRYFLTGLGSNLAGDHNWRSMATPGSTGTHQSTGAESNVPGAISLVQVVHSSTTTCSSPDGQFYSSSVCEQEGGHDHTPYRCNHRLTGGGSECGLLDYSKTYPRHI